VAKYDLLSSSTSGISVEDLLEISEEKGTSQEQLSLHKVSLTENDLGLGNTSLRTNLAALYSARSGGITPEDILITAGGIVAQRTVLTALLTRGDHVVCQGPLEEQSLKILQSLAVEVVTWTADPGKKWRLDLEELKTLLKENTKLILVQSPCNPTGAIVPKPVLEALVELAQEKDIIIVADEIYRPLFHSISPSEEDFPPSAINLGYRKVVVTGGVGKAYSLAGTKVGWIATKDKDILATCRRTRTSTSAAASILDEAIAAEALSDRCIHALLSRNIKLCQTNLQLLQQFVEEHSWACSWVKPQAGTIAMLKFHKMGKPVDSEGFCAKLLEESGVALCPASKHFGAAEALRGYVRVAFGGSTEQLKAGLLAWKGFMEEHFESVPTVTSKRSS
jgi:aspartate/methionine/tyrosine aminotransferase